MDHKDITIFLELVRCRNISKTAENLYLSQSAVSSRLKALEEEMGCQLVLRSKGQRSVELTRQGEEFISVAERWKLLLEETEAVKERRFLSFASPPTEAPTTVCWTSSCGNTPNGIRKRRYR